MGLDPGRSGRRGEHLLVTVADLEEDEVCFHVMMAHVDEGCLPRVVDHVPRDRDGVIRVAGSVSQFLHVPAPML